MRKLLEKVVPQNAPNRDSYIEQTLKLLSKAPKCPDNLKEEAVVLYAPMLTNFKNVALLPNRVDLMANGWVEVLAKNGFRISVNVVLEGDEFEANMAGFTDENTPPVVHKVKSFEDITWEKVKVAYCFAFDENNKMFTAPEVITKKDLETISKKTRGNVWKEFLGEMIKKSVIRRFIKRLGINDDAMNTLIEKWDEQHEMSNTVSEEDMLTIVKSKINECSNLSEVGEVWTEIGSKYVKFANDAVPVIIEKLKTFEQTDRVKTTLAAFEKKINA